MFDDDDQGGENVAWPSYVDFLSTFIFVLFVFIGSLLFIVHGQVREREFQIKMSDFMKRLEDNGTPATIEGRKIRWDLRKQLDFGSFSSELNDKHRAYLRKVARQLPVALEKAGDCSVVVLGAADSAPVQGDVFGNWRLSSNRALSVLEFLYECEDCGYDKSMQRRLTLLGEGDTKADRTRVSEEDRRVDLILDCSKNDSEIHR
jgi:flagellar motor protein MotB